MTSPGEEPDPTATRPPDPGDVAALEGELVAEDGTRFVRYAHRLARLIRLVAAGVVLTGVAALIVGLAAARRSPILMVIVAVLCLPAVLAPLYVIVRTRALARAASRPRELADQARDLVGQVRDSAELRTLARRVTGDAGGRAGTDGAGRGTSRLRGTWQVARLASTVVGQAQPDDKRHSLLVAFTPERLRRTWFAATISVMGWPVAAIVLVISVPVLILTLVF
ncbi:MAG: hypothetical protein ACR2MB_04595 [Acidimicrobiales bacterium]